MIESKIKKAIVCLYGAAVTQGLAVGYALFQVMSYNRSIRRPDVMAYDYGYPVLPMPYPAGEVAWAAIAMVGAVLVAKELKAGEGWAWLGAICVLVFCAFGFAIPFSVAGLLFLLDRDVRTEFLKKLEITI